MRLGTVHREDVSETECARMRVVLVRGGRIVAELPILDQRMADVDPEARDPAVEPEAQDALELLAHLRVPPVQVGLTGGEVVQVVAAPLLVERPGGAAAEDRPPVVRHLVCPDVEVRPIAEPGMAVGRVVRDEVEEDANPAPGGLRDQRVDVRQGSELRVHVGVVGDVVTPVDVRRRVDRVEPDSVDAQPFEVVQLRGQAVEVAHAVAVSVGERPGVDLVEDALTPPGFGHRSGTLPGRRPAK